jgi:hypothetical protein
VPAEDQIREDNVRQLSLDELAKGLANGSISRGRAIKLMGAALLGGVLFSIPGVAWAKPKPGKCNKNKQCPAGQTCVNRQCVSQGGCAHDICQQGGFLTPGCDEAGCVAQVCAADPFCCFQGTWDAVCVAEVTSICGINCPAAAGSPVSENVDPRRSTQ